MPERKKPGGSPSAKQSGSASGLKFTQPSLTIEQVLDQGRKASRLLGDTIFNLAYASTLEQIKDMWAQTLPHEREKREFLHHQIQALGAVTHTLSAFLLEAQALDEETRQREQRAQQAAAYEMPAGVGIN